MGGGERGVTKRVSFATANGKKVGKTAALSCVLEGEGKKFSLPLYRKKGGQVLALLTEKKRGGEEKRGQSSHLHFLAVNREGRQAILTPTKATWGEREGGKKSSSPPSPCDFRT